MIPPLIDIGAPWPVLPPGIHWASLAEIETAFATNDPRQKLFAGFSRVLEALAVAGCRRAYLDGSFVTGKEFPGDFDGCWDDDGVSSRRLDPVLLLFDNNRAMQKLIFRGEMFSSTTLADGENTFLEFFQIEKVTGNAKGIIGIYLA